MINFSFSGDAEAFAAELRKADGFLVLTHRRPDGDTVGSAAALVLALRRLGKRAFIYNNPEIQERLRIYQQPLIPAPDFVPETVVTVDIPSQGQMVPESASYKDKIDFAIDHHTYCSLPSARARLTVSSAAASGELVFAVIQALHGAPDKAEAEALYIAIATDTGCFKYSNTSAETHLAAAGCIAAGADIAAINYEYFEKESRSRVEIKKLVYATLKLYLGGRAASITVTQAMRAETGATEDDIDDFSSIPRRIEGVAAGISAYEQPDGTTKISLRTTSEVDAAKLCGVFNGGGHPRAAGCTLHLPVEEALAAVVAELAKEQA